MSARAIDVVGWAIVHSLWQGAALALGLAVLLAALRRRSPELRYVAACLTLLLMVALPVATAARGHGPATRAAATPTSPAAATTAAPRGAAPPLDASSVTPTQSRLVVVRDAASAARTRLDQPLRDALPALVLAWALGVALLSARLAGGWTLNQRLLHPEPLAVPAEWTALLRRLHGELRLRMPVRLALSARVAVPTVLGWLRPVVLFPASALTGLGPQQVELLLRHELAHVRRHDYLVNLLQSVAEVLLFHHPAAWWVSRRIRLEREHCCDDAVARAAGVPAYVRALVAMEALRPALPVATAGRPLAVGADGAPLLARVRRLAGLDARPASAEVRPAAPIVGVVVAGLVIGALVAGSRASEAAVAAPVPPAPAVAPSPTVSLAPVPACAASAATDSLTLCAPLTRRVEALLQESGAEGAVVVQDVRTGAVVSYAAASRRGDLDVGTAIVPASVWKLAIAALWWEHGLGDEPVACPATLEVDGRTFTNAGAPARAGMTAAGMLAQSCNTAAARMALALRDRVGEQALLDGLRRLGFPLADAADDAARDSTFWASSSAEWRRRMSPAASVLRLDPGAGDVAWAELAIGQPRVRVTPLHVSRLLQAIGRDGVMQAPTVERRIAERADEGVAVMRPETARRLRDAMRLVVREGTARGVLPLLEGARWSLGGKTGTSQPAGGGRADGWFVGLMFDEQEAPRYTVVVHLRGGGSGGGAAARLAATLTRELGDAGRE